MKEEIHRLAAKKINGLVFNNIMNECVYRLEEQKIKKNWIKLLLRISPTLLQGTD